MKIISLKLYLAPFLQAGFFIGSRLGRCEQTSGKQGHKDSNRVNSVCILTLRKQFRNNPVERNF